MLKIIKHPIYNITTDCPELVGRKPGVRDKTKCLPSLNK